jgi:hypothetical protein
MSKQRQLDASVRELRQSGTALAEAERAYKIKLREECLRLKGQGMAVTLIDKVCYGIPSVAELRFRRDCAETVYRANQDAINALKLEMRIIESQLQREWGQAR